MKPLEKRVGSESGAETSAEGLVRWLKRTGTKANLDVMARYGIPSERAFGVPVGTLKAKAKQLGKDHALAQALWDTGWYEARMLAAFVEDPEQVTARQMAAWTAAFDSWAICDTVCFGMFDKSPHAWAKARQWAAAKPEFVKRTAYVLMACLALHDKEADDKAFLAFLPLIERGAADGRNFVKKGVNWALQSIERRSPVLSAAATALAKRLAASESDSARWVGKDSLRQFAKATARVLKRPGKGPSRAQET